jgi:hypothetical protein
MKSITVTNVNVNHFIENKVKDQTAIGNEIAEMQLKMRQEAGEAAKKVLVK